MCLLSQQVFVYVVKRYLSERVALTQGRLDRIYNLKKIPTSRISLDVTFPRVGYKHCSDSAGILPELITLLTIL